jgi:hypothetical protein
MRYFEGIALFQDTYYNLSTVSVRTIILYTFGEVQIFPQWLYSTVHPMPVPVHWPTSFTYEGRQRVIPGPLAIPPT